MEQAPNPHRSLRLKPFNAAARIVTEEARLLPRLVALLWLPLLLSAVAGVLADWLWGAVLRRGATPLLLWHIAAAPFSAMCAVLVLKHLLQERPYRGINLDLTRDTAWATLITIGCTVFSHGVSSLAGRIAAWLVVDRKLDSEQTMQIISYVAGLIGSSVTALLVAGAAAMVLSVVMRKTMAPRETWNAVRKQVLPLCVVALLLGAVLSVLERIFNWLMSPFLADTAPDWLFGDPERAAAQTLYESMLWLPLNLIWLSIPAVAAATLFKAQTTETPALSSRPQNP